MKNEILIEELLQTLENNLQNTGLSKGSLLNYRYHGIYPFRKHYTEANVKFYDHQFNEQIIRDVKAENATWLASKNRMWGVRKVAALLKELVESGTITLGRSVSAGSKTVLESAYFQETLSKYVDFETSLGLRTSGTVELERILLRHFFAYLESKKHATLNKITLAEMNDFLTFFSMSKPGSISRMIGTLKKLYSFATENSVGCADFRPALIARPSPRRKLRPTLTKEQADSLVNSVDTSEPLGKRDYAIMMIAKWLGVRSGDILDIKFSDICWETREITLCQSKTSVGVVLPLPVIVGNAIADYILNGRPKSDEQHIFIRHVTPHIKLDSASNIFRRYDLDWELERGSGFHSFRRCVASQMLNAGVEPDTVKGVLGHLKIDSLKPYARISDLRLSACAIGLQGMETEQGDLC